MTTQNVWKPEQRLDQVDHAIDTVKSDPATVALRGSEYVVIVNLNGVVNNVPLPPKIITVDGHLAISYIGVRADAQTIGNFLRAKCFEYQYRYDEVYPVPRLTSILACKMNAVAKSRRRNPYAVILLVVGYDKKGTHIFQVDPFGGVSEWKAISVGVGSDSARMYLKENMIINEDSDCSKHDLICHGIKAILGTLPDDDDDDVGMWNVSLGVVGKDHPFKILDDFESRVYFDDVKKSLLEGIMEDDPTFVPVEEEDVSDAEEDEGELDEEGEAELIEKDKTEFVEEDDADEADEFFEEAEAEFVTDDETETVGENEAEFVEQIEAKFVEKDEAKLVENDEAKLVGKDEAKLVENDEAKMVENDEAEFVENDEAEFVENDEAKCVENDETKPEAKEECTIS